MTKERHWLIQILNLIKKSILHFSYCQYINIYKIVCIWPPFYPEWFQRAAGSWKSFSVVVLSNRSVHNVGFYVEVLSKQLQTLKIKIGFLFSLLKPWSTFFKCSPGHWGSERKIEIGENNPDLFQFIALILEKTNQPLNLFRSLRSSGSNKISIKGQIWK